MLLTCLICDLPSILLQLFHASNHEISHTWNYVFNQASPKAAVPCLSLCPAGDSGTAVKWRCPVRARGGGELENLFRAGLLVHIKECSSLDLAYLLKRQINSMKMKCKQDCCSSLHIIYDPLTLTSLNKISLVQILTKNGTEWKLA